jgi:ferric-dicitrate binding protein FerR (iron transport regulator)
MYLPDGSLASLNFNSKLDYPDTFMEDERVVYVSGEVYFDVKSVVNQLFIVNTRQARIEVMGTEFNVNTKGTGNHLEVLVKSGKVKLSKTDDPDQNIVIEPGYIGVLRNNTLEKRLNRDENYLAWTTGELIFKGHKLETVSSTLMKTYGITIEIADPEISSYRITTSFHGESIDTVLSVIVSTFNLNLEKKHDTEYIISGNSR